MLAFAWAPLSSAIAHGLGRVGQWVPRLEHWAILAVDRANSIVLPLLLLGSLKTTGVLDVFEMERRADDHAAQIDCVSHVGLSDVLISFLRFLLCRQDIIPFALDPHILHLDPRKPSPLPTPSSSSEVLHTGTPMGPGPRLSGDEHGDDDGDDEERTICGQVDITSDAAPMLFRPRPRASSASKGRRRAHPGNRWTGREFMKMWEATKAWMNPALVGGGLLCLSSG
ncbi:hypothetical protein FIBSPDRAFT_189292 [Athelia psychrophila]|uniref:Uncharacterized protein n=1 Tax=Athelia psychrophila TaxID=1759441 RepID=A0A166A379_9AGAM|nr:hypothetical protein FIBSPDRAFT_189292 [Fibularhizoctonia sp. CBS 109695]